MANSFSLTALINAAGPVGIEQVVDKIKTSLAGIKANIGVTIDPTQAKNLASVNKELSELRVNLQAVAKDGAAAATSLGNISKAFSSTTTRANSASKAVSQAATSTKDMATQSKVATTNVEEFGRVTGLALRRFTGFTIAASSVFFVVRSIQSAVSEAIKFERQMVKVAQVTNTSIGGLTLLNKQITSLATNWGVSSADLVEVAQTLAQAGFSANDTRIALDSLAKTTLAATFGNINDTTNFAIAALRQFGLEASQLENVLDSANAVAAAFAVESEDLGIAVQTAGATFALAAKGTTDSVTAYKQLLAVFTSIRQTTRESPESIATGLRTITTRLVRPETINILRNYGVELKDIEGNFIGVYEALGKIGGFYNRLPINDIRKLQIAEQLGGYRQVGKLIPAIEQGNIREQALSIAQGAGGSLTQDAIVAQQALAVQFQKTKENFLALGREIVSSTAFKELVSQLLTVANTVTVFLRSIKDLLPYIGLLVGLRAFSNLSPISRGFKKGVLSRNDLGVGIAGLASGGYISGGTANKDSVPAMLMPGEFVVNKKGVGKVGTQFLNSLNTGQVKGFADGGFIESNIRKEIQQRSSKEIPLGLKPDERAVRLAKIETEVRNKYATPLTRLVSAPPRLSDSGVKPLVSPQIVRDVKASSDTVNFGGPTSTSVPQRNLLKNAEFQEASTIAIKEFQQLGLSLKEANSIIVRTANEFQHTGNVGPAIDRLHQAIVQETNRVQAGTYGYKDTRKPLKGGGTSSGSLGITTPVYATPSPDISDVYAQKEPERVAKALRLQERDKQIAARTQEYKKLKLQEYHKQVLARAKLYDEVVPSYQENVLSRQRLYDQLPSVRAKNDELTLAPPVARPAVLPNIKRNFTTLNKRERLAALDRLAALPQPIIKGVDGSTAYQSLIYETGKEQKLNEIKARQRALQTTQTPLSVFGVNPNERIEQIRRSEIAALKTQQRVAAAPVQGPVPIISGPEYLRRATSNINSLDGSSQEALPFGGQTPGRLSRFGSRINQLSGGAFGRIKNYFGDTQNRGQFNNRVGQGVLALGLAGQHFAGADSEIGGAFGGAGVGASIGLLAGGPAAIPAAALGAIVGRRDAQIRAKENEATKSLERSLTDIAEGFEDFNKTGSLEKFDRALKTSTQSLLKKGEADLIKQSGGIFGSVSTFFGASQQDARNVEAGGFKNYARTAAGYLSPLAITGSGFRDKALDKIFGKDETPERIQALDAANKLSFRDANKPFAETEQKYIENELRKGKTVQQILSENPDRIASFVGSKSKGDSLYNAYFDKDGNKRSEKDREASIKELVKYQGEDAIKNSGLLRRTENQFDLLAANQSIVLFNKRIDELGASLKRAADESQKFEIEADSISSALTGRYGTRKIDTTNPFSNIKAYSDDEIQKQISGLSGRLGTDISPAITGSVLGGKKFLNEAPAYLSNLLKQQGAGNAGEGFDINKIKDEFVSKFTEIPQELTDAINIKLEKLGNIENKSPDEVLGEVVKDIEGIFNEAGEKLAQALDQEIKARQKFSDRLDTYTDYLGQARQKELAGIEGQASLGVQLYKFKNRNLEQLSVKEQAAPTENQINRLSTAGGYAATLNPVVVSARISELENKLKVAGTPEEQGVLSDALRQQTEALDLIARNTARSAAIQEKIQQEAQKRELAGKTTQDLLFGGPREFLELQRRAQQFAFVQEGGQLPNQQLGPLLDFATQIGNLGEVLGIKGADGANIRRGAAGTLVDSALQNPAVGGFFGGVDKANIKDLILREGTTNKENQFIADFKKAEEVRLQAIEKQSEFTKGKAAEFFEFAKKELVATLTLIKNTFVGDKVGNESAQNATPLKDRQPPKYGSIVGAPDKPSIGVTTNSNLPVPSNGLRFDPSGTIVPNGSVPIQQIKPFTSGLKPISRTPPTPEPVKPQDKDITFDDLNSYAYPRNPNYKPDYGPPLPYNPERPKSDGGIEVTPKGSHLYRSGPIFAMAYDNTKIFRSDQDAEKFLPKDAKYAYIMDGDKAVRIGINGSIGATAIPRYNVKNLAMGGVINGAYNGTDNVPAMLMPGEFVVRREVAQRNMDLLHQINSGDGYAFGGKVGRRGGRFAGNEAKRKAGIQARRQAQDEGLFNRLIERFAHGNGDGVPTAPTRHFHANVNKLAKKLGYGDVTPYVIKGKNGELIPALIKNFRDKRGKMTSLPNESAVKGIFNFDNRGKLRNIQKFAQGGVVQGNGGPDLSAVIPTFNAMSTQLLRATEALTSLNIPTSIELRGSFNHTHNVVGEGELARAVVNAVLGPLETMINSRINNRVNPVTGETSGGY